MLYFVLVLFFFVFLLFLLLSHVCFNQTKQIK